MCHPRLESRFPELSEVLDKGNLSLYEDGGEGRIKETKRMGFGTRAKLCFFAVGSSGNSLTSQIPFPVIWG